MTILVPSGFLIIKLIKAAIMFAERFRILRCSVIPSTSIVYVY